MEDIPIEQMDERRLRTELASVLVANQLLFEANDSALVANQSLREEKLELLEENRKLRKANLSFAPNQIKLRAENKRLEKGEQLLDALEAAGVDNWEGYDEALKILREEQNE